MKWQVRLLLVSWMWGLFLSAVGDAWAGCQRKSQDFVFCQIQGPTLYDMHVPILKMFKRQIRNFQPGRRASLTLVFRSSMPVVVRWFKKAPNSNMGGAEVPNMLPIEGDPMFKVGFIRSGDVTATSLIIPKFNLSFSQDFETIITSEDGNMQYQLRSVVNSPIEFRMDDIDSPEWLAVPPPTWKFRDQQHLKVHCKAFVPNDIPPKKNGMRIDGPTNELIMHRAQPDPESPEKTCMKFESVLLIHKDTTDYAEKNEHVLYQGERKSLKHRHAIYSVKMTTYNATTQEFEGVYQCAMDRQQDKLYVISEITAYGKKSPLPTKLRAELIPCDGTRHSLHFAPGFIPSLTFYPGEETCFRCRGMGHPRPQVAVYDPNDVKLTTSPGIGVTKYINVKDGGVSEVTITIRDVRSLKPGIYACKVYNIDIARNQPFQIKY